VNCKWKTHYACSALALALTATLAPVRANAQVAAPTAEAPAAEVSADASLEATAEAEVAADPGYAPPPPPPPPVEEKPLFRWYGIIKPTIVGANGLESFGNPNYSAPTAAANPVFLKNPDSMGLSFQVAQTRFGLAVGEGLPVSGKIELDFVEFTKSSPAQSALPRLRQAFIDWTPATGHKITMGQLWDIFSPLNSHTYNLVGGLFQSGNAGFMRHQLIYMGTFGNIEAGGALGLTAQNNTPALNGVEYGRVPTLSLRVGYRKDKTVWAGVSAIASRIVFDAPTNKETAIVMGGNGFADLTFGALNLRAEVYGGQNLANIGTLTIGQGNFAAPDVNNVAEIGGWVSAKYTASEAHAFHVVAGGAAVLDDKKLAQGFTPGTPAMGMTAAVAPARTGIGIINNISLRAGYAYTAYKGFSIVAEPFLILTKHKIDDAILTALDIDDSRTGYGLELGGLYSF
jgi:hypothetical protein